MLITIITFLCLENDFDSQRNVFKPTGESVQQHIYDNMWLINALLRPSDLSDFNIFYYRKEGEGGGQKVMIGIIIGENVDNNYGRPLIWKHSFLPAGSMNNVSTQNGKIVWTLCATLSTHRKIHRFSRNQRVVVPSL